MLHILYVFCNTVCISEKCERPIYFLKYLQAAIGVSCQQDFSDGLEDWKACTKNPGTTNRLQRCLQTDSLMRQSVCVRVCQHRSSDVFFNAHISIV